MTDTERISQQGQQITNLDIALSRARARGDRYEALYMKAQRLFLELDQLSKEERWSQVASKLAKFQKEWEFGS